MLICAPLGHDPLGTPQGPSGCGPERSRARTGRPEPKSLTSQGDAAGMHRIPSQQPRKGASTPELISEVR